MQLLEELKKQNQSGAEVHLHDVSLSFPHLISSHLICFFSFYIFMLIIIVNLAKHVYILLCVCLCQLRTALATLSGEGFLVVHGDSVKRI